MSSRYSSMYKPRPGMARRKGYQRARIGGARARRQLYRPAAPMVLKSSAEVKGLDTSLAATAVVSTTNTNDFVIPVNLVVPGNGSFNRVGRKIHMRSLRLYGTASVVIGARATTGDIGGNTLRMIVVYDKQPSGVLPTFADIFGTTSQAGTETSDWNDPLRYDNTSRFRVLRDKKMTANPRFFNAAGGTLDTQILRIQFDEYLKLNNSATVYSGQSDPCTIADISSGALYVIFRAEVNTAGTDVINVSTTSHARLRYTD